MYRAQQHARSLFSSVLLEANTACGDALKISTRAVHKVYRQIWSDSFFFFFSSVLTHSSSSFPGLTTEKPGDFLLRHSHREIGIMEFLCIAGHSVVTMSYDSVNLRHTAQGKREEKKHTHQAASMQTSAFCVHSWWSSFDGCHAVSRHLGFGWVLGFYLRL